jgi:hypothetical protein
VGSVAEEAARLLDALGGWASTTHNPYAAKPASPESDEGGRRCESCGAENGMGQAVTCQLCPVCQGLTLLRSVRPETVDRLADLAGAVTEVLRDLAAARRTSASGSSGGSSNGGPTSRVHDIPVTDDDGHDNDGHDNDGHDEHEPDKSGSATR